jgi:DNA repair protein RadC
MARDHCAEPVISRYGDADLGALREVVKEALSLNAAAVVLRKGKPT